MSEYNRGWSAGFASYELVQGARRVGESMATIWADALFGRQVEADPLAVEQAKYAKLFEVATQIEADAVRAINEAASLRAENAALKARMVEWEKVYLAQRGQIEKLKALVMKYYPFTPEAEMPHLR